MEVGGVKHRFNSFHGHRHRDTARSIRFTIRKPILIDDYPTDNSINLTQSPLSQSKNSGRRLSAKMRSACA
jgi:hypothetical protein